MKKPRKPRLKKPSGRQQRPKKSPGFIDYGDGIDWGAELQYIADHPNDPAVVAAERQVRSILQKHGLIGKDH